MLIIISPAKTLDFESQLPSNKYSQPDFLADSSQLIELLQQYDAEQISKLMGISPKLAQLNFQRYHSWNPPFTLEHARQAVFAFKGDVYTGLNINSIDAQGLNWAQQHLRILSGLYGILRPLDLMQPYRLEMGTKLANNRGANLVEFWQEIVTDSLNKQLDTLSAKYLLNLASNEYFNAVNTLKIKTNIISPVFKDFKNGQYKVISFFAKKARGMLSQWVINHRVTDAKQLRNFDTGGYLYNTEGSTLEAPLFLRKV